MSIRSAVISQIQQIATETNKHLPPLTDDLALLDSGLDSLTIAIVVTRLEDTLGLDPFTETDDISYRSEEHTSELQSHSDLVCRLLLEKKKNTKQPQLTSTPHP